MADETGGTSVDRLQIEIEATSSEAEKRVNALAEAIKRLGQSGTEISRTAGRIREIRDSASSTGGAAQKKAALTRATGTGTADVMRAGKQLNSVDSQIEKTKARIQELSDQLRLLDNARYRDQFSEQIAAQNQAIEEQKSLLSALLAERERLSRIVLEGPKQVEVTQPDIRTMYSGTTLGSIIGDARNVDEVVSKLAGLNDQITVLKIRLDAAKGKLKAALETGDMGKVAASTDQIQKLQKQIENFAAKQAEQERIQQEEANRHNDSLQARISILQQIRDIQSTTSLAGATGDEGAALRQQIESYRHAQTELASTRSMWTDIAPTNVFGGLRNDLAALMAIFPRFGRGVETVRYAFATLIQPAQQLLNALRPLGGAVLNALASFGKFAGNRLTAPFKNAIAVVNRWQKAIGRVIFYRAVRSAITMITRAFQEGTQNLYQYSKLIGTEFAPAMDSLATNALYLKNSLAAMAAPLIQAIAPAVDFLIEKFVALLNVIGKVFAALTGKSTYTQAVKFPKEFAASANDAAKAAKNFSLGIDELNVISETTGGNSGSAEDYGSMFEETEVPTGIADWAAQIREAIENGEWRSAGEILAGKLNEIVDSWDARAWGQSLGQKINNGLNAIYGFMKDFDFTNLGAKFANGINGIFESVDFDLLGRTLATKWNALVDFLYGVFTNLDWALIGTQIAAAVNGWFDEINWEHMAETVNVGLQGIFTAMKNFIAETHWEEIGNDIVTFLNGIDWAGILSDFFTTFAMALNAITTVVSTIAEGFEWQELGLAIGNGINDFFNTFDIAAFLTGIVDFAWGILEFLSTAVQETDWGKIGDDIFNALFAIDWPGLMYDVGKFIGDTFTAAIELIFNDPITTVTRIATLGYNIVAGLLSGIVGALGSIGEWLKENFVDPIVNWVKELFGIHSPSTVFEEIGKFLVEGLLQGISGVWTTITDFFTGAVDALRTFFSESWENIKQGTSEKWTNIKETLGATWDTIKTAASEKFTDVKEKISTAWTNVKTITSTKWDNIKTALGTTWENIKTSAGKKFDETKLKIYNAWENTRNVTATKWDVIKSSLTTIWENVKATATEKFTEIKDKITDIWDNLITAALQWGKDLCHNIAEGIMSGINTVVRAAQSVAEKVASFLHFSEPDVGPLSDFHTYMPDMLHLMAEGIKSNTHLAVNAAEELADSMSNVLSDVELPTPKLTVQPNASIQPISANIGPGRNGANYSSSVSQNSESEDMSGVIYAAATMIVEAINSKDQSVYLDGKKLMQAVERQQRSRGANIMAGGVMT